MKDLIKVQLASLRARKKAAEHFFESRSHDIIALYESCVIQAQIEELERMLTFENN